MKQSMRVGSFLGTVVIAAFAGWLLVNRYGTTDAEARLGKLLAAGAGARPLPVAELVEGLLPFGVTTVCMRGPYGADVASARGESPLEVDPGVLARINAHLQREDPVAGEGEWNLIYAGDAGVRVLALDAHQVPFDVNSPRCVPFDIGQFEVVARTQFPFGNGITLARKESGPPTQGQREGAGESAAAGPSTGRRR